MFDIDYKSHPLRGSGLPHSVSCLTSAHTCNPHPWETEHGVQANYMHAHGTRCNSGEGVSAISFKNVYALGLSEPHRPRLFEYN